MNAIRLLILKGMEDGTLNVKAFAKTVGCSRQHIYDITKQKAVPTLEVAEKIAEYFGCELRLDVKRMAKSA